MEPMTSGKTLDELEKEQARLTAALDENGRQILELATYQPGDRVKAVQRYARDSTARLAEVTAVRWRGRGVFGTQDEGFMYRAKFIKKDGTLEKLQRDVIVKEKAL